MIDLKNVVVGQEVSWLAIRFMSLGKKCVGPIVGDAFLVKYLDCSFPLFEIGKINVVFQCLVSA